MGSAIVLLNTALALDDKNAEIYNLLAIPNAIETTSTRHFKYYERALAVDPKHRGAHEYMGEAYLMTGNLAKAEEQLAVLNKLYFLPCEEYSDLKSAIAECKQKNVESNSAYLMIAASSVQGITVIIYIIHPF